MRGSAVAESPVYIDECLIANLVVCGLFFKGLCAWECIEHIPIAKRMQHTPTVGQSSGWRKARFGGILECVLAILA